jgi:hypothetical protein
LRTEMKTTQNRSIEVRAHDELSALTVTYQIHEVVKKDAVNVQITYTQRVPRKTARPRDDDLRTLVTLRRMRRGHPPLPGRSARKVRQFQHPTPGMRLSKERRGKGSSQRR